MPGSEQDNIRRIRDYQQKPDIPGPRATLKGAGGGGTYDDMEARVANLEKRFDRFDGKLDQVISGLGDIKAQVAEVKGQLSAMPTAIAFGELKGRVDGLPTTAKVASLIAIAAGFVTVVTKWPDLIALFHK